MGFAILRATDRLTEPETRLKKMKTDSEILDMLTVSIDDLTDVEYKGEDAFGRNHWVANFGDIETAMGECARLLAIHSRLRAIRAGDKSDNLAQMDNVTWRNRNGITLCEPGTQAAIDMILERLRELSEMPANFLTGWRIAEKGGSNDGVECLDAAIENS